MMIVDDDDALELQGGHHLVIEYRVLLVDQRMGFGCHLAQV